MSPTALAERPVSAAPRRSRPLRVLDITSFYSETASGGVKTYLHGKARYLAEQGVSHAVVVPGNENRVEVVDGSRFHRVAGPRVWNSRAYRTLLSVESITRILEAEAPDVVEVGSPFFAPWLLRRATHDRPPPTLGFYHADVVRTFAEPYVPHRLAAPVRVVARMAARRLVRDVYSRFDLTVAASRSVAEELRSFGIPRVSLVSLGVDLETFRLRDGEEAATRAELGARDQRPVGLYVGRFAPEKRLDVVLDGHARIQEALRPHLVLVGDGPLRPALAERVRHQAGLTLLPYQTSREALARIYGAADFYLAAGPGETFGLSIAEGLASGLAVVTVDRGAAPDRVAGAGVAEMYAHGDPESATGALRRILPRLTPALRLRARAHAEASFDWTTTFRTLLGHYEQLAVRRRA